MNLCLFLSETHEAEQDSGDSESKVRGFTCLVIATLSQMWRMPSSCPSWRLLSYSLSREEVGVVDYVWCLLHPSKWKVNITEVLFPLEQNLESKAEKLSRAKRRTTVVERTLVQILDMTRTRRHLKKCLWFFVLKHRNEREEISFMSQMPDLSPSNKLLILFTFFAKYT